MPNLARIPEELRARPQWVLWRYEDRGGGKPTKVPYTAQGYKASSTNPNHWSRFSVVVDRMGREGFADGIGFVFTADDPYCGLDLDAIYPSDAAEPPPWAQSLLGRFADTYLEESPSGTGIKIWCIASPRASGTFSIPDQWGHLEIYSRARYFAVTGRSNGAREITDHTEDVERLIGKLRAPVQACANAIGEVIPYHTQHPTLVSLAGTMRRRGLHTEEIDAALQIVNRDRCERPGTPTAIRKIAESAGRWKS